jgi:hypothetical protein
MAWASPRKDLRTSTTSLSITFDNPVEHQEEIPDEEGESFNVQVDVNVQRQMSPDFGHLSLNSGQLTSDKKMLGIDRLVQQVDHFLNWGFRQALAFLLQGIGKAHGNVLHVFVGFLGAAHQEKFLAARDALVPVGIIEPNSKKTKDFWLVLLPVVGHWGNSLNYFLGK